MKKVMIFYLFVIQVNVTFSQMVLSDSNNPKPISNFRKKLIDDIAIQQWPTFQEKNVSISKNGSFFTFSTYNHVQGMKNLLVIQSTVNTWMKEFEDASVLTFSADNRQLVFMRMDTLCLQTLGEEKLRFISGVHNYKFPEGNKDEWLAYQLKNETNALRLLNLVSEEEQRFDSVTNYYFNESGTGLLLEKRKGLHKVLDLVNLRDNELHEIYKETSGFVSAVVIDKTGRQVAFSIQDKEVDINETNQTVWYYKIGMKKAMVKVDSNTSLSDTGLLLQPYVSFSDDGQNLWLKFRKRNRSMKLKTGFVKVNVWSYHDSFLQSYQLKNPIPEKDYYAVLSLGESEKSRLLRIEHDDETIINRQHKGEYVVVRKDNEMQRGDRLWLPLVSEIWLVSTRTGNRIKLKGYGQSPCSFSPDGRYLICYDEMLKNYYCVDLISKEIKYVSSTVTKGWLSSNSEIYKSPKVPQSVGIAGWIPDNNGVLVYDNYDIWLLDPTAKKAAVNITGGFGRLNKIKFKVIGQNPDENLGSDTVFLAAYNTKTKYNGFYRLVLKRMKSPELLTMGPYTFYHWNELLLTNELNDGMQPLKADNANCWIVNRQSFNEAPNYYYTKDFKKYFQLTNIQPQNSYNWLTAELVHFKQLDNTPGVGILYKPEDFDVKKKYPVLINYYDNFSSRIFQFPKPLWTRSAHINIPWFVSRGYLVFTPDITFIKNLPGPAAYNSVVAAAQYLSKVSYVDSKRMGIAGHSFAGGMTNFLVTQTKLFAAAFEGAGVSDLVSSSLQLAGNGSARGNPHYPQIWEQPDLWVKTSPIMNVHKVTTPLLMFHCRPDGAVPFEQAIEFFLALRQLNKKVWLIEYDNGDHSVIGKNAQDLTIRVNQFFDHYLNGVPAPVWMTRGIQAKQKGIEDGIELDLPNR